MKLCLSQFDFSLFHSNTCVCYLFFKDKFENYHIDCCFIYMSSYILLYLCYIRLLYIIIAIHNIILLSYIYLL